MNEVRRSILRDALRRHITLRRTEEIMEILSPLFYMCERGLYFYGQNSCVPDEIHTSIALLTNRPCSGIEGIAESMIPLKLVTSLQNSNFVSRTRAHLQQKLTSSLETNAYHNFVIDFRLSFGERLQKVLPQNLWSQLWETIQFWLLSEINETFKVESNAFEQVAQLCVNGSILFDTKPTEPTIMLIVNAKTAPITKRFHTR